MKWNETNKERCESSVNHICTVRYCWEISADLCSGENVHSNTGHISIRWRTRISPWIGQIGFLYQKVWNGDVSLLRDHRHTASSRIKIDYIVMMKPEYKCRRLRTVIYRACDVDHVALFHIYLRTIPNDSVWHCRNMKFMHYSTQIRGIYVVELNKPTTFKL